MDNCSAIGARERRHRKNPLIISAACADEHDSAQEQDSTVSIIATIADSSADPMTPSLDLAPVLDTGLGQSHEKGKWTDYCNFPMELL